MNTFVRFLITGGIAALVNAGSRYLLNTIYSFEVSVAVAYLIGMITAYILARLFVFKASGRSAQSEFARFALVNAGSLVLVWGISVGLVRIVFPAAGFTWHAEEIGHFIGVAAPAVTSYFAHRAYTFADDEA